MIGSRRLIERKNGHREDEPYQKDPSHCQSLKERKRVDIVSSSPLDAVQFLITAGDAEGV